MSGPSTLQIIREYAYEIVISGGYKKGGSWGGAECGSYVDADIHIKESCVWLIFMGILYVLLKFNDKVKQLDKQIQQELDVEIPRRPTVYRILDIALATIAFTNWFMVLYYKINLRSLINLLQPCHLVLLAQAFALKSNSSTGIMISLLSLPMVSGSGAALLFPDTSGLDQWMEEPAFWLQHYFIQSVPLYLLLRYNFLAARIIDFKTITLGAWILVFMHWIFFEPIDYMFHVNVNFFLCPASAMESAFEAMVPKILMWPSYRTFIMWFLYVTIVPTCYAYVGVAKLLQHAHGKIFGSDKDEVSTRTNRNNSSRDVDTNMMRNKSAGTGSARSVSSSPDHIKRS